MKPQVIAPLAMAAAAAGNGFAPIAAATSTATTIATGATVQHRNGNAKITAHPVLPADHAAHQQPHSAGICGR